MESGDIAKLADPNMEGKYEAEQLHRVVLAASYCVRQSSIWRPSMTEVHGKMFSILLKSVQALHFLTVTSFFH